MRKNTRWPAADKKEESWASRVGIFWVLNGEPLIDSAPLPEAEPYGDHLTHPRGHAEVWEQWQRNGAVSPDMEYEEPPRGRVMYNKKTHRFTLLADKCVLKDRRTVSRIMLELHLPRNTETDTDSHYRCFVCLQRERAIE